MYSREENWDEWHSHDDQVKQVEPRPAESARMQDESVGNHLQTHLEGEHGGEEVVEVVQNLEVRERRVAPRASILRWQS